MTRQKVTTDAIRRVIYRGVWAGVRVCGAGGKGARAQIKTPYF